MCTVSWLHQDGGYQLLCNRDEKRTRGEATGPSILVRNGVRYIAPTDGGFGGSWIATNEFGLTLCLLNGVNTTAPQPKARATSRGLLLLDAIHASTAEAVCEQLDRSGLYNVAPFTLVALEPGMPTAIVEWDGETTSILLNGDPLMPLISSSFDTANVRERRRAEFTRLRRKRGVLDASTLFDFHQSHSPIPGPYSPCMHRPDAETVSFSGVKVTGSEAKFFYAPGAPCQWRPGQTHTLPIRQ